MSRVWGDLKIARRFSLSFECSWMALGLMLLMSIEAMAARPARVEVDEAPVYAQLAPDSQVLAQLTRGSRIIVSNVPTQGFYKARVGNGVTGWISAKALVVFDRPTEEQVEEWKRKRKDAQVEAEKRAREAEEDAWKEEDDKKRRGMLSIDGKGDGHYKSRRTPRHFTLGVFLGGSSFNMEAVKTLTQLDVPQAGFNFGLELHYLHRKSWVPFLLRIEHLTGSKLVKDTSTGNVYDMTVSSTPIMVGFRVDLLDDKGLSLDLALLAGFAINNFSSVAANLSEPNKTELSAASFAAMLKADLNYAIAEYWFVFLEGGYRSLNSGTGDYLTSDSNAGTTIFKNAGSLKRVSIDMSGFFMSLGVSYNF